MKLLLPRRQLLRLGVASLLAAPAIIGKAKAQLLLTGAGKGNRILFATLDGTQTNVTMTNGNLTATHTNTTSNSGARSTSLKNSGKYYIEYQMSILTGQFTGCGILTAAGTLTNFVTDGTNCAAFYQGTGAIWSNGAAQGALAGYTATDFIGLAVDLDNDKVWFRANSVGLWNNGLLAAQNPATNTGGFSISNFSATTMGLVVGFGGSGTNVNERWLCNFGQAAFNGAVPSGFTSGWPA